MSRRTCLLTSLLPHLPPNLFKFSFPIPKNTNFSFTSCLLGSIAKCIAPYSTLSVVYFIQAALAIHGFDYSHPILVEPKSLLIYIGLVIRGFDIHIQILYIT
jgi:hypothetical protein